MTPTRAQQLADAVTSHVATILDMDELAADPFGVLDRLGLDVAVVEPEDLPPGCSIAATYDRDAVPPRIRVSNDLSGARRKFSVLHEFAHHLRDDVDELVDALWDLPAAGDQLEEKVCDAFAAAVLLPAGFASTFLGDGVTAPAVVDLIRAGRASREACAVTAAQWLPAAGYVMLLDRDGNATFTATAGLLPRVARGTPQDDATVLRSVAGRGRVRFASGVQSGELLLDVAHADGWSVAVWVEHSPAWGGLTVAVDDRPAGLPGYCENCATEFVSYQAACGRCGEPRCAGCGSCACPVTASPGERKCPGCNFLLPARAFATGAQRCRDCA